MAIISLSTSPDAKRLGRRFLPGAASSSSGSPLPGEMAGGDGPCSSAVPGLPGASRGNRVAEIQQARLFRVVLAGAQATAIQHPLRPVRRVRHRRIDSVGEVVLSVAVSIGTG